MDAQALIQHAIEQNVVAAAQQVEDQIDQQLAALDKLDSEDIETLRQKRVLQLKLLAKKKQEWLSKGHGELTEVLFEKEFFKEMKGEERMICHFYRENWPCKVCCTFHCLHQGCISYGLKALNPWPAISVLSSCRSWTSISSFWLLPI